MALRRLASEAANGLGLRYGASVMAPMAESSFGLKALFARGYATGMSSMQIIHVVITLMSQCMLLYVFLTWIISVGGCSDSQRQVR